MTRARKLTPSYLKHKQSGRARAVWADTLGIRHFHMLPGKHNPKESRTAFAKLELEIAASPTGAAVDPEAITLVEILAAHKDHVEQHYRRADGTPTHERVEYFALHKLLDSLYGEEPAAAFGPLALKAVRAEMVRRGWCRNLINQRIARVRRIYKWAAGEELVGYEVFERLRAVTGLQAGRTSARESEPIEPVAGAVVDATLPYLNGHVAGLVRFQRLTGCRPGEACIIRCRDLETGGAVWLYKPAHHKLAYRGRPRVIPIGPKAQEVLREFFTANLDDYLFSPQQAVEEFHAYRTANRKTPLFPSHERANARKRVEQPGRPPAPYYTTLSYGRTIARACDLAFPPSTPLAREEGETLRECRERLGELGTKDLSAWQSAHRWHPNQLRHTFATDVRKAHGPEAAQVLLGHSRADVTQVYAERNESMAVAVAAKIG